MIVEFPDGFAEVTYDPARAAGLPQRMLRYQFGPFFGYFNVNRLEDLLELTEYALKRSSTSEEAIFWRGLGAVPPGRSGTGDQPVPEGAGG